MINVIKASGQKEPYSQEKLLASVRRAGIPKDIQQELIRYIESNIYDNIPTSQIYKYISDFFKQNNPYNKSKYSLKKAIMELGPTGYPFEDFVAEILEEEGYSVQTRQVLEGKCISHEIDVLAQKGNEKIAVEAKFHNQFGIKTDIHVALYVRARFEDLQEKHGLTKAWIATNTKMTEDAINYSACVGINLMSWSYPNDVSLRALLEKHNIHPITQLESLSSSQKQTLLQNHHVLCRELKEEDLLVLNLPKEKIKKILEEARYVSSSS